MSAVDTLVERLRARTFSRWESDIQAVMDYEDELCTEAASALEAFEAKIAALTAELAEAEEANKFVSASWVDEKAKVIALTAEAASLREELADIKDDVRQNSVLVGGHPVAALAAERDELREKLRRMHRRAQQEARLRESIVGQLSKWRDYLRQYDRKEVWTIDLVLQTVRSRARFQRALEAPPLGPREQPKEGSPEWWALEAEMLLRHVEGEKYAAHNFYPIKLQQSIADRLVALLSMLKHSRAALRQEGKT